MHTNTSTQRILMNFMSKESQVIDRCTMLLAKLKKLFKIQSSNPVRDQSIEDEPKHSSYFVVIMAEIRVSRYFLTAEDVTKLMQSSTLKFCSIIKLWRGSNVKKFELLKHLSDEDQLTQFGRWVIQAGQALGQKETNGTGNLKITEAEYNQHFEVMIPLAKDAAKLRRKLCRISDKFVEDLKKLKVLVEKQNQLEENPSYTGSNPDSISGISPEMEPVSSIQYIKMRLKDAIQGGSGKQSRSHIAESLDGSNNPSRSIPSRRNYFSSSTVDLKTPSAKPSKKHLQRLADEFGDQPLSSNPGEKSLSVQILHENSELATPSNAFKNEPRQKSSLECDPSITLTINANEPLVKASTIAKEQTGHISQVKSTNDNEYKIVETESSVLDIPHTTVSQSAIALAMIDEVTSDDSVSETSETIVDCNSLLNQMQSTTSNVVTLVRSVERSWLTIPQLDSGSASVKSVELKFNELLEYIVDTAELLGQNELEHALPSERRERFLTALDIVYKEIYTCFVTVAELTQMVSTDVAYLKELMLHIKTRLTASSTEIDPSTSSYDSNERIVSGKHLDLNTIFD